MEVTDAYLARVAEAAARVDRTALEGFLELLKGAYRVGRTIFLLGNGGSAANASHFAQDLAKGTLPGLGQSRRFRALALTNDVSLITALANDEGYDRIFEQQLMTLARAGDLVLAISCSGNSPNVVRAVEYANAHGMITVGITAGDGGRLGQMANHVVAVPTADVGLAEAVHAILFHLTVDVLRAWVKAGESLA
jgi:D-sedoheptulose 7-phosphate isomerase